MVTSLILKDNHYICGNCFMRQSHINPYCHFCHYEFGNWIDVRLKIFKEEEELKNEDNIRRRVRE